MDKLFLDANVLFSAAYSSTAGIRKFWNLSNAHLITSAYAVEEARRNLSKKQHAELNKLLNKVIIHNVLPDSRSITEASGLSEKDKPILLAAIEAKATHLITGDFQHFGPYYGKKVGGVLIVPPARYLKFSR